MGIYNFNIYSNTLDVESALQKEVEERNLKAESLSRALGLDPTALRKRIYNPGELKDHRPMKQKIINWLNSLEPFDSATQPKSARIQAAVAAYKKDSESRPLPSNNSINWMHLERILIELRVVRELLEKMVDNSV